MDKQQAVLIAAYFFLSISYFVGVVETSHNDGNGPKNNDDNDDVDDGAPLMQEDYFPFFAKMDDNYRLEWKFNSTHIVFKIRVKTKGYVGFGISKEGGMFPADVIIAWVDDDGGRVHFKDRHTIAYFTPPVDGRQDWDLVSGFEDDQYTAITTVRLLDTCDETDDMPITDRVTNLIYSYSPDDPTSEENIVYHGFTRGTKPVALLNPPAENTKRAELPSDVTTVEVLNQNVSMSTSWRTIYSCQLLKLPQLKETKHHMIRYEPVIQKGNEDFVRRITLYYCQPDIDDTILKEHAQFDCLSSFNAPYQVYRDCKHVAVVWAVGGPAFDFPPHVGFSFGDSSHEPAYFMLETHYETPNLKHEVRDNSGLRFFVTKQLRQHDAGMLKTGVNVDGYQIIPPYSQSFLSTGTCYEGCLEEALGDEEIHLFSEMFYSHLVGKRMITRHVRNGTELAPIFENTDYDTKFHETRILSEERTVKKGDSLVTDCYYDTAGRSFTTFGDFVISGETCLAFLYYYPKKPLSYCLSRPIYKNLKFQGSIFTIVTEMDFTNKTARDEFENMIDRKKMLSACKINGRYESDLRFQPVISHPFVKEDKCKKQ